jgi:hypothetical protein
VGFIFVGYDAIMENITNILTAVEFQANEVSLKDLPKGTLFRLKDGRTYAIRRDANGGVIGYPVANTDGKKKWFHGMLAPKEIGTLGSA